MAEEISVAKIGRMVHPESLKSIEYQPWSRGRGVDVWSMICACITGDLETVKSLVARDPNLVDCEYEYFKPVRFAVRENQRAVVNFLLDQGAGPDDEAGESLLVIARERGYTELATLFEAKLKQQFHIVPEGAEVAAAISDRDTARVRAMIDERPELVHAADERGNQPIHWAVMTRQIGLIDYLLDRGAGINARRPNGLSPIHLTNGDYHYRGWRDLPSTALQRHEVLIGYLLARGADYDISIATKIGDLERVRELLDQSPDLVNQVPAYSYYTGVPLRNAAAAGHLEVVKLLLERGANPNQPEPGIAPFGGALHAAIGGKHFEVVKVLLQHGADPNAAVESSGNCLSMAKFVSASKEMVDLIASYGGALTPELADIETLAAMLNANPLLPVSEKLDNPPMMELILRYQPDILKRTPDPTPWWSNVTPKTPEFARWLMERGLDPNRSNWLGIRLLHRCANKGDMEIAKVCLEFGADIDAVETEWSSTALGWASREGRTEMAAWLLERGANPNLPGNEPWARPIEWARRRGHQDIVEILQTWRARGKNT